MIPRHRPPFGFFAALTTLGRAFGAYELGALEEAFAAICGVPHAIWLPSARAGIGWALESVGARTALTTAFTCSAVHEAILRAGARPHVLDVSGAGFLVTDDALVRAASPVSPLVLCEIYGHAYDLAALAKRAPNVPLRVVDLAMTVPTQGTVARLAERDVGIVSFGIGKCCYAGWGGIAFMRDGQLARKMAALRAQRLDRGTVSLAWRRAAAALARLLAHERWLYRASRTLRQRITVGGDDQAQIPKQGQIPSNQGHMPTNRDRWPAEWRLPSTRVDRALLARNLERLDRHAAHRLRLAHHYDQAFAGIATIRTPPRTDAPRSHYTIRVPASARDRVRAALWRAGIDTGIMFTLPSYLSPAAFPNAARLAREVINLPINHDMVTEDVDHVARSLTTALLPLRSAKDCSASVIADV
jgi:dTDP-4-amino-4,6-dideoxygalactose transaminase